MVAILMQQVIERGGDGQIKKTGNFVDITPTTATQVTATVTFCDPTARWMTLRNRTG